MGGLFVPSNDLIECCKITESVLRVEQVEGVQKLNEPAIVRKSLQVLVNSNVFSSLRCINEGEHNAMSTHVFDLMKSIVKNYITVRLHHIAREQTLTVSGELIKNRNMNLIKFKGQ